MASIWLQSDNRDGVAAASDALDSMLRFDPLSCGESRDGGRRIIYLNEFAALFHVAEEDRRVAVVSVWTY